jgi:hypothetical protein
MHFMLTARPTAAGLMVVRTRYHREAS